MFTVCIKSNGGSVYLGYIITLKAPLILELLFGVFILQCEFCTGITGMIIC